MEQKDKFFRLFLFCGARRPFARFGNRKSPGTKGLIVIRYYLALRGAENGVTAMVTPFFCVQG